MTERGKFIDIANLEGYSGKLGNRLKSTFDACRLRLDGGMYDGKQAKSFQMMPSLPAYPLDQEDLIQAAGFNNALPKIYEKLLLVNDQRALAESYIDGLGGNDIPSVHKLAQTVAKGERPNVAIRIVQGATDNMPLRSLSYVVPGLILTEKLKEAGIDPQLQVINAVNISSGLSGVDKDTAQGQAKLFASVSQSYVDRFFPQLSGNVVYLQDKPLDIKTFGQIEEIGEEIREHLSPSVRDTLSAKGQNHNAEDKSFNI